MDNRRHPFESWTDRLLAAAVILALAGLISGLAGTDRTPPLAPAPPAVSEPAK